MHTVEQVYAIIERKVVPLGWERGAAGGAFGRVLAQAVAMEGDSPPFDRSQLDGFAVRAADAAAGAKLFLVGRQDAGGKVWQGEVGKGQCVGINTGGIFPAG